MSVLSPLSSDFSLQALRQSNLWPYYEKVMANQRLTREDAIAIYNSHDLLGIGLLADRARLHRTPPGQQSYVYWVHNFHINPTNICEAHCKFCSFKKGPQSPHAYIMEIEDVVRQVNDYPHKDTLAEFHIVSGLYQGHGLAYYSGLFRALRHHFPHVHIKGLTAVEMDYIAQLEGLPVEQVLTELKASGLKCV
jgi:aminodeoxyfutalosine synthase